MPSSARRERPDAPAHCHKVMPETDPDKSEDKSTQWAAQRTDLAEDRNIMAMERTFAGWIRTSFAAIGIGLGFKAVFGEFQPPWLAKAIATMFIMAGGLLAYAAQKRACNTLERLSAHEMDEVRPPNFKLLAACVMVGSLLLTAGLWLLNDESLGEL